MNLKGQILLFIVEDNFVYSFIIEAMALIKLRYSVFKTLKN